MHEIVSVIRDTVRMDVSRRKVVDVDDYCRLFAPLCPDLSIRQLEEIVL